jgi:hypothetical protein
MQEQHTRQQLEQRQTESSTWMSSCEEKARHNPIEGEKTGERIGAHSKGDAAAQKTVPAYTQGWLIGESGPVWVGWCCWCGASPGLCVCVCLCVFLHYFREKHSGEDWQKMTRGV